MQPGSPDDDTILNRAGFWERRILTAYSIWEVFRSKWALRFDGRLKDSLMACDDLAWACYEPAMKHYSPESKEPPLLYLGSTWSPFYRRRGTEFRSEVVAGLDASETVQEADYLEAVSKLPIPLLGLPWFQVADMPGALLIAHEVGHAVEFDFQLTPKISEALRKAGLDFEPDWRVAQSEVFADLYACLCLGPYFASALMDLMVASKASVNQETRFANYPTRGFRLELAVQALEFQGLQSQAAETRKAWEGVYGKPEPQDHLNDASKVVRAVYSPEGMNLQTIIQPPATGIVRQAAEAAATGQGQVLSNFRDVRVLFCAARLIQDLKPAEMERTAQLLIRQILDTSPSALRGKELTIAGPAADFVKEKQRLASTKAADEALLKELEKDLDL